MKLFAFFLPQFHAIPENDNWWGKGFTEWTNIKAAKRLFKQHKLLHPLNSNYYCLLNKTTMNWQTSLLDKYHIDGLIYYHYYFNGKLLLEKPSQNLLKWKDINQKFFFCWANHPWNRSWEGKRDLLMPMEYGDKEDWEKHFKYLLPFFNDDRYEKKDNMPLFMVFISEFNEKEAMFSYFDKRCKEEGFNGLCLIETCSTSRVVEFEKNVASTTTYSFLRQPSIQQSRYLKKNSGVLRRLINKINKITRYNGVQIFNGNDLMDDLLKSCCRKKNIINGLWFEWDNTYRHQKRGYIITPYSKDRFVKYMNMNNNSEYVFINAWNEWCEGMVLEPTEENGYKYLEWIREWKNKQETIQ